MFSIPLIVGGGVLLILVILYYTFTWAPSSNAPSEDEINQNPDTIDDVGIPGTEKSVSIESNEMPDNDIADAIQDIEDDQADNHHSAALDTPEQGGGELQEYQSENDEYVNYN